VILERTSQPADHPVLLNFPESRYLKGFIIEIRA
jgi:23S rRNA G2069 N7-methylase RlmK/C1962 C5-methylase RlmI